MAKQQEGSGLTGLILQLMDYTPGQLEKADPRRAADYFNVREDHAAGYIRLERQQRGLA